MEVNCRLLQLTKAQVRELLDNVVDEPIVYWVKKPNAPIDWQDGQLPGVYEYLSELKSAHETSEPEPVDSSEFVEASR